MIHLGPVNYLWKQLNNICDMEPFEMQHNLVKSDRQKREFQGPEIKKLLNKLDELRTFLPTQLHPFVDTLEKVKTVYKISHAISVDTSHRKITADFKLNWISMMTTYGMNMPLKVHIISEDLSEYFKMTGKTLRKVTDQVVESAHHKVKNFFSS